MSHTIDNYNEFKCKRFIQLLNSFSERKKANIKISALQSLKSFYVTFKALRYKLALEPQFGGFQYGVCNFRKFGAKKNKEFNYFF